MLSDSTRTYFARIASVVCCTCLGLVTTDRAAAQTAPAAHVRVMYTGHSFAGGPHEWMGLLTKQAGIVGYESLGRQALGASRVVSHWNLADAQNQAKTALRAGKVDVLALAPNMQMPDEGIDRFVDLALEHNPHVRVLVQGSWMTWDGLGKDGIKNAERDQRPVAEIRERNAQHMAAIRSQLRDTNRRVGREVCTLIPVGTAVVRLRELIADGKLPGIERPSQLFNDDIGHGSPAIPQLTTYLYYVALFHRDPSPLPGLGNNGWSKQWGQPHKDLGPLLKQLAWETMQQEPLGGVPRTAASDIKP
jgi:hypothetical protein